MTDLARDDTPVSFAICRLCGPTALARVRMFLHALVMRNCNDRGMTNLTLPVRMVRILVFLMLELRIGKKPVKAFELR